MNNEKKAPVRQIKFRGLRVDGKGWVYGTGVFILGADYAAIPDTKDITSEDYYMRLIKVVPKTVGQFTGLLDKNGKEIYDGDKMKYNGWLGVIEFNVGAFFISYKDGTESELNEMSYSDIEIIGNIHERKETKS